MREEQFTILYIEKIIQELNYKQKQLSRYNKSTMKTYIIISAILMLFLAVTIEARTTDATPPAQPSSPARNPVSSWGSKPDGCHCYCHHECECKDDGKGDVPDYNSGELPEGLLTSESDSTNNAGDEPAQDPRHGHGNGHGNGHGHGMDMGMDMGVMKICVNVIVIIMNVVQSYPQRKTNSSTITVYTIVNCFVTHILIW